MKRRCGTSLILPLTAGYLWTVSMLYSFAYGVWWLTAVGAVMGALSFRSAYRRRMLCFVTALENVGQVHMHFTGSGRRFTGWLWRPSEDGIVTYEMPGYMATYEAWVALPTIREKQTYCAEHARRIVVT